MPRPRYEKLDPEKKQKLMASGVKEFAAHGYENASINRILEDAGFSKGAFYYYFDDKADLAVTVLVATAEPFAHLTGFREPHDIEEFWSELRRVSLLQLKHLEANRVEYECMARLSNHMSKDAEFAAKVLPRFKPARNEMLELFTRGAALGAVRRDLPPSTLFAQIQATKSALYASIFPGDRVPTDAELESFTELIFDMAHRICSPSKG
jgi:AcrR family transcriptional regulator